LRKNRFERYLYKSKREKNQKPPSRKEKRTPKREITIKTRDQPREFQSSNVITEKVITLEWGLKGICHGVGGRKKGERRGSWLS